MKLFSLLQLKFDRFETEVHSYLSRKLSSYNTKNSSIFGQLINVLGSTVQNIMSYIEDSLTEQNKYTATRKRSIYNLASISGYNPSTGTAASAILSLSFIPNNLQTLDLIVTNKTQVLCSQNGLKYNIILPQEAIVMSVNRDNSTRFVSIVEGLFESQQFTVYGGELYTQNVIFNGDVDLDYVDVFVNEERWERVASLYDMNPDGKQYVIKTALKKGIDIIFGNDRYGRALQDQDQIRVEYLLHSGERGNINPLEPAEFSFVDSLQDLSGADIDGNEVLLIQLKDKENINCGTDSEDIYKVREMIGLNSRSLVLADPKNYKQYLSKFSFVGYNRTWSEPGSLIINSLIIKNYKQNLESGLDYFNLRESDFKLSSVQKQSILNNINNSGQQLAGAVFNVFDPEIVKYAMYVYLKLKSSTYNTETVSTEVRKLVGEFFANIKSDIFIPKSDIIHLLKDNIDAIDGVDVYFISELNERALIDRTYTTKTYSYNPALSTYDISEEVGYLYGDEDPGLGLDSHGNIYLDNTDQFPVLMGGWQFISSATDTTKQFATVTDPLTIIFE